jgi:glycosyltransferase involved in cell wall biosynthesis
MPDVSVVIPVRNAERLLEACLASITRNAPREIIVVDGMSTDGTLDVARRYGVKILSDEGGGLPAARLLGAEVAASERVALVDADVVMPDGGLAALVEEFEQGGFTALQAGQLSVSGPAYWGQALVNHHRTGRSKNWFGLVATLFDRKALLEHGFDARFLSGEDIELRWRLQRAGARIGVSERTIVEHRFEDDSYDFAKGQWLADGHGLGRMVVKHGARGAPLLGLPLAAAVRGIGLSLLRRQPKWIRYYSYYMVFNYVGMVAELGELWRRRSMTRARLAA